MEKNQTIQKLRIGDSYIGVDKVHCRRKGVFENEYKGLKATISDLTSNSVEAFIKAVKEDGIDCHQWFIQKDSRVKDLPRETNLQTIKVELPTNIYKTSSLPEYGIKTREVYLQGWVMGDFFVKLDPSSTQIYPMFWTSVPEDYSEWDVIKEK